MVRLLCINLFPSLWFAGGLLIRIVPPENNKNPSIDITKSLITTRTEICRLAYRRGVAYYMAIITTLNKTLSNLHTDSSIEASAIVSRNGILVTSNAPGDARVFAAMAATVLGAAEITAEGLDREVPKRMIVESRHGRLIIMGAGRKMLLVALVKPNANLGMLLMQLDATVGEIAETVEQVPIVHRSAPVASVGVSS